MSSGSRREASGETRQEDSILDRLLRQMGIDTGSQRDGERTGESYLREWRRKLGDCWSRTAVRIERHLTRTPYLQFNLEGIHKDGLLWAECRTEDTCQRYRVRIGFPQNDRIPMACSCRRAEDGSICVHQLGLLNCVQDALASSFSRLSKLLLNQHFAEEVPESRLFKFDERQYFLDLLEGLPIDVTADELESEANCSELVLPNEITETRIAWRLKIDPDDCEIRPILQQAKKRGNGFTKGRPLGLDNLRAHLDAMTDRDRQVVDSMQVPFGYHHYRAAPELDACHCMTLLIGADNIYLDDQPVELVFFAPLVVYESDDKHCWLALAGSTENDTLHLSENHLVRCQPDSGRVEIAKLERVQVHLLQTILYLPKAPIDLHEELLSRLPAVSKVISCRIPESNAGAVVQDRCTTVVLIRSRADGSIDYGLRIRDLTGSLRIAGQGLCVRHTELDGAKIQLHRQVDQEISLVSSLADKLGVTRGATDGSIQDFDAALQFLDRLQSLESAGVDVLWDKTSEKPVRVLGTVTPKNLSVGITQKRDWFQLTGNCNLNGDSLDLADLLSALNDKQANQRGDYVRIGDKGWTKIEKGIREQLQRLRDSVSQERRALKFDATSVPAVRDFLDQDIQLKASRAWRDSLARLEQAETLEPKLPKDLNANLRDYQIEGFNWLSRLAHWGVGGILADDMGLGKTLQTLATLLDRKERGPCLVIAPTSVGANWIREAQRFAPTLQSHLYRETDRDMFLDRLGPGDLVVCSYGLALRDSEALAKVSWASLVLDEAQAIKNSRSKTSIAIASISAEWKLALTGTPVENHLGELWSLFHVVAPGVFGGWEQFRKRFALPIEKADDPDRRHALRSRLPPFVLRRTKSAVLKDLPPRSEMNIYVELSPAEREIYEQVRLSAIGEIDKIAKLDDVKDQRFRILALLTRLRQLACSPRMVHDTWTAQSSKLLQLRETLQQLREEGHRVLVFSQFVKHLTLIREMLDQDEFAYEYLDGSTPAAERQDRVDRFQNGNATAFLISLKAGGTGLNLTAADYVIHMDPWWNPAVEDQATDRAHRMGQEKPVMVYRLISSDTIEEEILKLHDSKRDLVSGVMEGSHAAAKLSTEDLIALVRGNA